MPEFSLAALRDWFSGQQPQPAAPGGMDIANLWRSVPIPGQEAPRPRVIIPTEPDRRYVIPEAPDDSKMVLGSDPNPRSWSYQAPQQQASTYEGSPTENLSYDIGRTLEGFGLPSHKAYEVGSGVKDVLSFVPGIGSGISWGEAKDEFNKGNYGLAALNTAMAAPIVPAAAAAAVKRGVKGAMKRGEAGAVDALAPTGSLNPLDNVPVTFRGKQPKDFTPEDLQAFGEHYGAENMGPLSALQTFKDVKGNEFQIPGGTEGNWTYADLLHMKANPINPANVDRALHTEMQRKLGRTMTPNELSDADVWNGLVFGMTSPNNPLFPNQVTASRMRLRTPEMLDDLASMIPWKAGETPTVQQRKIVNDQIAGRYGLDAASKGGLGTRGTADYSRVAEMAQLFKQNPDFFRKAPEESWTQAVERISSQLPGLSMKTGSFGTVWQNPAEAAISAIDRHMARELDKRGGIFETPKERTDWENRSVSLWNKREADRVAAETEKGGKVTPADPATDFDDMLAKSGSDGFIGEMMLDHVGKALTPKFRTTKGEINPKLPEHLAKADWVKEPETVFKVGKAYKQALEVNQKIADEHGLNLFMSQWMEWDRIRNRFEPHENMFPGLSKLPAMSLDQLRMVDQAHKQTGHKTYGKTDEGTLQPTRPFSGNPSQMGYFGLLGTLGGAAALAPGEERQ